MEHNQKQELAFLYLQGALEPDDKSKVFHLILHDEEFRRCLKLEVEMRERMKQLRTSLDTEIKEKLLLEIRKSAELRMNPIQDDKKSAGPGWLRWSEWTLQMTLPPLVFPIVKSLQRRIYT